MTARRRLMPRGAPLEQEAPVAPLTATDPGTVQFATPDDLAARLGITLTAEEQTRATALIASASGLIQAEAKQRIERVENDVLTINGTSDERILLPERPVESVTSITLDGTPLSQGADWFLEGNSIVRVASVWSGVAGVPDAPFLLGSSFGRPNQTLTITYTHGFDPIPEVIKAICLEAVVRVWVNPGSVMRERMGSEQTDYHVLAGDAPTGLLLSKAEQRMIRRMFGRAITMVSAA